MTTTRIDFSSVRWKSVEWTNLCTLYLRACESRLAQPILGDRAAAEAVDRIDYDFKRVHRTVQPWANQFLVALRAKKLDVWATDFLDRHRDAVVLHLGCGLDTRALRVNKPPATETTDWFDVDQPGVIDLRRKLYDDGAHYRMIGSSVTDAGWLDQIPADRPALIVAEGLLMYLDEPDVRELLQRITDRFGRGEILFDTLSSSAPRLSRMFTGGIVKWGTGDAREVERWNPRLRFREQVRSLAGYEEIPFAAQRMVFRVLNATPAGRYDVLNRFEF
ncbi:class I SAM-dependent methyltransferase [Mycobacterium sp. 21AC1]|uniref:class I SAM-dependent methyltransferase n=1 Tax=[Mycobacterium] appelbergii TaxID=2939269 RepID=UPI0029390C52|nr:class I SAM-dependent methyltransferase [Mycobacterium sp. 21AC1]MDV3129975.1 class I SAM-dependent methyltransferase [Mycobacterium sp. 21AC1]